jgi:hypothetical protein
MRIYFDTSVLRHFSVVAGKKTLSSDLQAKLVLSPISALELLSHLSNDSITQAFAIVQGMRNWLSTQTTILDIAPLFIRLNVTGNANNSRTIFDGSTTLLKNCLCAHSMEDFRNSAKELCNFFERARLSFAQIRMNSVLRLRERLHKSKQQTIHSQELHDVFVHSIATRAGVESTHPGIAPFIPKIEAHYQHQILRIRRAIENPNLSLLSKKRQNDLFGSDQLLYLAVPDLHFVTTDWQAYHHLLPTEQGKRIHIQPQLRMNPESIHDILGHIVEMNQ